MKNRGEANIYVLIHQVTRNGYALLSSVSHNNVVASVLGISGLILAITTHIKFGRFLSVIDTSDGSKKRSIAGLQNLGNNCFFNVILQALASCASFSEFIECVSREDGFSAEEMPLTHALTDLLRVSTQSIESTPDMLQSAVHSLLTHELCILHEEKMVLSPRKVMLAMDDYIPSFNLAMQQDAAEAFLHLLSSLREELSDCYIPHYCSLADIYASPFSRIYDSLRGQQGEQQRWQKYLLGPFDGILCSTLGCRSCSSQLSVSYEFFHSLSLPPLLDDSETILNGSSIENCLKKFTALELVENYRCNHCWHNSAIKYLSTLDGNETQIGKLKCCAREDSCDCKSLFAGKATPWSKNVSCTIKQLRVARCPRILCIHLQRASVNMFGESVKLQGHIAFPMILDLYSFTKDAVGMSLDYQKDNVRVMKVKQHQASNLRLNHLNMQLNKQMLQSMYGAGENDDISKTIVGDELGGYMHKSSLDKSAEAIASDYHPEITRMPTQSDNKISGPYHSMSTSNYIYQLVAVVEHFGRVGSGHYTVYRRVKYESDGPDCGQHFEMAQWFCASDSKVFSVLEEDVLAAEASLLFYERTEQPKQDQTLETLSSLSLS